MNFKDIDQSEDIIRLKLYSFEVKLKTDERIL